MAEKRSKTLGDVIREARVAAKKGLREFSRDLGIAPSYQSDIENDRRVPAEDVLNIDTINVLLAVLNQQEFGSALERFELLPSKILSN